MQAALLESSDLTSDEERATVGWLPHHTPDYARGDPASGFYEVPLGHPNAASSSPAGPHHGPHLAAPTPPVHHDGALVQSSSRGTVGEHTSIAGDTHAGWLSVLMGLRHRWHLLHSVRCWYHRVIKHQRGHQAGIVVERSPPLLHF